MPLPLLLGCLINTALYEQRKGALTDIDGDGLAEVVVAAPFDATWAAYGGAANVVGWDGFGLVTNVRAEGREEYGFLGSEAAGGVDADGDGVPDYTVSASGREAGAGRVRLLPGGDLAGLDDVDLDANALLVVDGDAPATYVGSALAPLGDLDGDGTGGCWCRASTSRHCPLRWRDCSSARGGRTELRLPCSMRRCSRWPPGPGPWGTASPRRGTSMATAPTTSCSAPIRTARVGRMRARSR